MQDHEVEGSIAESNQCMPIIHVVDEIRQTGGVIKDFRLIPDSQMDDAVTVYNRNSKTVDQDWDFVALADLPDGAGLMMAGFGDEVCEYLIINSEDWYGASEYIEGRPI